MQYLEFAQTKPTLKRDVINPINGKDETEIFKPFWNRYSNTLCYFRLSKIGRKTTFGYTLKRAFDLLQNDKLELLN